MKRIRALVAEDSLTVRRLLADILSASGDFEVIGEAEDGKQAIELCQALRPDVVTLDMMMPVMTGLAATEYIMAYCPTPILIVPSRCPIDPGRRRPSRRRPGSFPPRRSSGAGSLKREAAGC